LRIAFPPLRDAAGTRYRLTLEGVGTDGLGFWASAQDALALGSLTENALPSEGDLSLTGYYAYRYRDLLGDLWGQLVRFAPGLLAMGALLGVPGLAGALFILRRGPHEPMVWLGAMLTAGLAFWPLAVLWTTTGGLRLTPAVAWALVAALAATATMVLVTQRRPLKSYLKPLDPSQITAMVVILLAIALRLVQSRDLLVPAWVDSVHHTTITTLIAESGTIPLSGEPYVSITNLHYHFGFHADAAVLSLLSGMPPAQSVLLLGQVLSGLAGLPLYALTLALAGKRGQPQPVWRWAGAIAVAVPSFLTYMPAFYASWGRYTQLAGLVMLPGIVALSLHLAEARTQRAPVVVLGLLVGGMALTHYRVLAYYALLWVVLVAWGIARGLKRHTLAEMARIPLRGLWLALIAVLVIAPWAIRFAQVVLLPFDAVYGSWAAPDGASTSWPSGLMRVGYTEHLLLLAGIGWLYSLASRHWRLALFGTWALLCALASQPHWLGLPSTWFVHGTSAAISYWLPAGVFVGQVAATLILRPIGLLSGLRARRYALHIAQLGMAGALIASATAALWTQADCVNADTVLVTDTDRPAIAWVRQNLPPDSLILVNTAPWQVALPMGSDAGWWLPYLAERRVTYPPVLFVQGEETYRASVRALAELVQHTEDLTSSGFIQHLEETGVTHVFVGTRGGPLTADRLRGPHYVELFRYGPTRVYAFVAHPLADDG
jgi:hypothetical protein